MRHIQLNDFDYSAENLAYFITIRFVTCMDQKVVRAVYETVLRLFDKTDFACDVLGVMPDHLHIIIHKERESQKRLSDLVCMLKSKSLYHLKKSGVVCHSFWQRGYYEHVVRNENDFTEKRDYIVNNPVKAGLVTSWDDYEFMFINDGATQGRPLRVMVDTGTTREQKSAL